MKESEECVDEKPHPLWHKVPDALLHHTSYDVMVSSWKEPFTTIHDDAIYSHLLLSTYYSHSPSSSLGPVGMGSSVSNQRHLSRS